MKNFSSLRLLALPLFAVMMLSSCMSSTRLEVLRPGDITLPGHIQKFVLADRTRPDKKHEGTNIIEGIFTGEGVFADKYGAMDCLEGLRNMLISNPRFSAVVADTVKLRGTGTSRVPPALSWAEVERICKLYDSDALVVLETFDSNSNLFNEVVNVTRNGPNGTSYTVPEYHAKARVNVNSTWRVYDVKTKTITDEFPQSSNQLFEGVGNTEAEAAQKLPAKRSMINRAGVAAGTQYGYRIAPQWIWVSRSYYSKGSPELKAASRQARTGNWDAAYDQWASLSKSSSEKTAKRASHNMALAEEVRGNLDNARNIARDAYARYGNRRTMYYANELDMRIAERERLKEQMKSKEKPEEKTEDPVKDH